MKDIVVVGAAAGLDLLLGDPPNVPHPIRYVGKWIEVLEKAVRARFKNLKLGGFVLLFGAIAGVLAVVSVVIRGSEQISPLLSNALKLYIIYTSLAAKCLDTESRKVYRELERADLEEARVKIGYLVGRDTTSLDESGVTRAAVETVAENTVDGVLAPLFYIGIGLALGIPAELAYVYKTVNTLDSMVGYKNEKYGDIGYASAKFDDILNYIPARLGSLLMMIGGFFLGYNLKSGLRILARDRKNHKSPNCGYPESAVAGLLGIQLGGTNVYFGEEVYKPTIGDKSRETEPGDIIRTIRIMYASEVLMMAAIAAIYLLDMRW